MNKTDLKHRWSKDDFLSTVLPLLRAAFVDKALLDGGDFRGVVVGLDGSPRELLNADLQKIDASNCIFDFSSFSCSFSSARMKQCSFQGAHFDTCRFKGAQLAACDFAAARFASPFLDDATFNDCSFKDAVLSGRGLSEYGGRRVKFARCDFTGATLKNLQFRASAFEDCKFDGAKFTKCLLVGVKFERSNVVAENFANCSMQSMTIDGAPTTW